VTPSLFARESPRPAALMRIGLGLVLLWDAAGRWGHVVELYSADGLPLPLFPGTAFEPPALPAMWATVLYALLLYSLAGVVLGWQTRASLLLAFVLSTWLGLLDAAGTFKKYSVIGQHLLVLLVFTQSHVVWSVDAWFRRKPPEPRDSLKSLGSGTCIPLSACWPRFLARVMISSVYLGAVVTKLRLPDFANGDVLMFSLLDERWGGGRFGMWLATQPALLVLASFSTILFEMAAALLLWIPQTRRTMLVLAIGFHVSIGITLHVEIFSPLMTVALLAFLQESDLQALGRVFRRCGTDWQSVLRGPWGFREFPASGKPPEPRLRRALWSFLLFLCAGGVWTAFVCAQHASRLAEANRWSYVDEPTSTDFLASLPPRVEDYFHRMEIGSRLGYRQVFGERERFPRGSTVYVMVRTAMQRQKPLKLDWVLRDAAGAELQRHERTLQPAFSYVSFAFQTSRPRLPAGEYEIVLEAEGKVAVRKSFRLRE
jgi:HTTM domain